MLNVCPNVTLEVLELSKHYSGQPKLVLKRPSVQPRIKAVLVRPVRVCAHRGVKGSTNIGTNALFEIHQHWCFCCKVLAATTV